MAFCKLYCIEFNVYEEELAFSLFGEYVNHYIPTGLIDLTDYTKLRIFQIIQPQQVHVCSVVNEYMAV